MNIQWATALAVEGDRPGCLRVACRLDDGSEGVAVAYTTLCPAVEPGHRLLLNTTAVDLGLGTGGVHFVIANASDAGRAAPRAGETDGHIMKLRYTPLQTPVLAAEEPASPLHGALRAADRLDGLPVVCCELLSQVPGVLAGLRHGGVERVVAVMTDEAALPLAFSSVLWGLQRASLLEGVVTAGQAFGGRWEAVNVYSGMLTAAAVGAEAIVVTPGPGTVGTGTVFGTSAVAQGQAINATHSLGGSAVAVLRASAADPRVRHRGISHHTSTVLARVALCPFWAAWPEGADPEPAQGLCRAVGDRMRLSTVPGASAALDAMERDWQTWVSMGRTRADDPLFFEASAAAGVLAARIAKGDDPRA